MVYLPSGGTVTVDLAEAKGELAVEWFNPDTAKPSGTKMIAGEERRSLTAPFPGHPVLCLARYMLNSRQFRCALLEPKEKANRFERSLTS